MNAVKYPEEKENQVDEIEIGSSSEDDDEESEKAKRPRK